MRKRIAGFCILFGLAVGCSAKDENVPDAPLPELYQKALGHYKQKNYKKAIEYFQAVERQYPYDQWTIQAQLMIGYLQYIKTTYADSINSFKLFIELNPYNKEVPYALYMLGMNNYQQLSIIQRDQSSAKDALEHFEIIVEKYPTSIYATDAKLKVKMIKDHLAGKHVDVARFYLKNKSYDAAISRLIEAIGVYPESEHVPEAKWRLVEAYEHLGLKQQGREIAQDILRNHPKTTWATYAERYLKGA